MSRLVGKAKKVDIILKPEDISKFYAGESVVIYSKKDIRKVKPQKIYTVIKVLNTTLKFGINEDLQATVKRRDK